MSSEPAQLSPDQLSNAAGGRGMLIVVSSPSGGGKGTLIDRARKSVPNLSYSVSYTTRSPRPGEVDGREYFFVSRAKFEEMIAAKLFLEWAWVHGNLYGTSRDQVMLEIAAGRDIILEIDVQGATSVRALMPDAVCIFILPPSFEILRQRLATRGTDSPEDLERRLRGAPAEVEHYKDFQYVIINDDLERASAQLSAIIYAERARCERQEEQLKLVLEKFPGASRAV
ncbi:MAG: guanylate kinase [Pyrinomonadaceae bacterium]